MARILAIHAVTHGGWPGRRPWWVRPTVGVRTGARSVHPGGVPAFLPARQNLRVVALWRVGRTIPHFATESTYHIRLSFSGPDSGPRQVPQRLPPAACGSEAIARRDLSSCCLRMPFPSLPSTVCPSLRALRPLKVLTGAADNGEYPSCPGAERNRLFGWSTDRWSYPR